MRWISLCFVVIWLAPFTSRVRAAEAHKSLVAVAQDRNAVVDYIANPDAVQAMVDALVTTVTGKADVASAWRSLVDPSDRIGIKVSTDGGRYFSSHHAVVDAIVRGLERAGVPRANVIVWDRDEARLRAAGYLAADRGYRVRWVEPRTGYDPQAQVAAALFGRLIWGDLEFVKKEGRAPWDEPYDAEQASSTSHLCSVMTREVTKVINVPVLSDAMNVGVAGCIYNMTVRNVDNWRRFLQAPTFGDPYLAELYADERVGGKVVLNVMDGLIAQYARGPGFEPAYALHLGALFASKDPVALDAIALHLIDGWRKEANLPPASPRAGYIQSAGLMGIGHYAPERIELREIGRIW